MSTGPKTTFSNVKPAQARRRTMVEIRPPLTTTNLPICGPPHFCAVERMDA
ncbi:hypothetical protein IG631_23124 [Alternaria alternata]|nr:hypothetical protein IG631_23124 [Alternaria alternata]